MQRLRRLVRQASYRRSERAFVLEGANVVGDAMDAGVPLEAVFVAAGADDAVAGRAVAGGTEVLRLAPGVLERVAGTVTPQPVLAVAPWVDVPLDDLRGADLLVVCVDVRDPGNAGTVVRSAEAAGAGGVICCDGSVDVFNPKTVRASAGSLFHTRVVSGGDPVQVLDELAEWGLCRLGAAARGGIRYDRADLGRPVALVLGNEARGLPPGLEGHLDGQVTIPMAGRSESLNVGMAAAVLCFEAERQRRVTREREHTCP